MPFHSTPLEFRDAFRDMEDAIKDMADEHGDQEIILAMISWLAILTLKVFGGNAQAAHDLLEGPLSERALADLKNILDCNEKRFRKKMD